MIGAVVKEQRISGLVIPGSRVVTPGVPLPSEPGGAVREETVKLTPGGVVEHPLVILHPGATLGFFIPFIAVSGRNESAAVEDIDLAVKAGWAPGHTGALWEVKDILVEPHSALEEGTVTWGVGGAGEFGTDFRGKPTNVSGELLTLTCSPITDGIGGVFKGPYPATQEGWEGELTRLEEQGPCKLLGAKGYVVLRIEEAWEGVAPTPGKPGAAGTVPALVGSVAS